MLAEYEVKDLFRKSGGTQPYIVTRAELGEVIHRDSEKYAKIIKDLKLAAEE